jgi:hypothetical protein
MATIIKDVHIVNTETGIKSDGPNDLVVENVTFDNVRVPYDISGARSASIRGTRIPNDPKIGPSRNDGTRSSVGWRKLHAPPLPAFCPSCKSIFASRNYLFAGMYFNCWNNEETCPECYNEHATLSEGIFNLTKEIIEILRAPDITYALVQALITTAESTIKGTTNPDEAEEYLNSLSPRLGKLIHSATSFGVGGIDLLQWLLSDTIK